MTAIGNGSCGVLVNIDHKLLTVRKERLGPKGLVPANGLTDPEKLHTM